MRIFFRKKRPENEAVIDLTKLKEIEDRQKKIEEISGQNNQSVGFLTTLASAAKTPSVSEESERLERFRRRFDRALERLELLERKIERIENRIDLKY